MLERDRFSSIESSYVKVGIVNKDKPVARREKEHQTGNPRLIFAHHEISSLAVQMLETSLHNHFSSIRVKGEWFLADQSKLDQMVSLAENRATELYAHEPSIEFMIKLNKLAHEAGSTTSLLEPELSDVGLTMEIMMKAHAELAILRKNKLAVAKRILALREQVDHPDEIFKIQDRKGSESVSVAKIRKLFPELASKFETSGQTWTYTLPFLLDATRYTAKTRVVEVDDFGDDILSLHAEYLSIWSSISDFQWDFQMGESQLLYLCGDAQALEYDGQVLVAWESNRRSSFMKSEFVEAYPEEASQCIVQTDARTGFSVAEWKAY